MSDENCEFCGKKLDDNITSYEGKDYHWICYICIDLRDRLAALESKLDEHCNYTAGQRIEIESKMGRISISKDKRIEKLEERIEKLEGINKMVTLDWNPETKHYNLQVQNYQEFKKMRDKNTPTFLICGQLELTCKYKSRVVSTGEIGDVIRCEYHKKGCIYDVKKEERPPPTDPFDITTDKIIIDGGMKFVTVGNVKFIRDESWFTDFLVEFGSIIELYNAKPYPIFVNRMLKFAEKNMKQIMEYLYPSQEND